MAMVTISTKYQIVIPQRIHRYMKIKPGQKMHVIAYNNMITLIPVRPIKEARGSLKGINTNIEREETDHIIDSR